MMCMTPSETSSTACSRPSNVGIRLGLYRAALTASLRRPQQTVRSSRVSITHRTPSPSGCRRSRKAGCSRPLGPHTLSSGTCPPPRPRTDRQSVSPDPAETVARLDRKMAFEFVTRRNLSSAEAAIEDGFRALGTLESVEKGWLELMRAWAVRYEGKLEATYDHGTAALQIFQRHGDLKGQARTLVELARVEAGWDRSEAAEEHLKEALQIVRSFEDPFPLARVLASLAHLVGFGQGDTQQASAYYHEIDALATKTGNPAIRDFTLGARAYSDLLLRMDFQTAERG